MPKVSIASRKPGIVLDAQEYEDVQDLYEQHDILDGRALKQDVADSRAASRKKKTAPPDKIKLMKDIGVARSALRKGKPLPPVGGKEKPPVA